MEFMETVVTVLPFGLPFTVAFCTGVLLPSRVFGQAGVQIIWSFSTNNLSGTVPGAELIEGSDGILYGTTVAGGADNRGTVYKLNKDGAVTP